MDNYGARIKRWNELDLLFEGTNNIYCLACRRAVNSTQQWEDHIGNRPGYTTGKHHRKRIALIEKGLEKVATRPPLWPGEQPPLEALFPNEGGKEEAGEVSETPKTQIVAPPEVESTKGKSEAADWLNDATEKMVKLQSRVNSVGGRGIGGKSRSRKRAQDRKGLEQALGSNQNGTKPDVTNEELAGQLPDESIEEAVTTASREPQPGDPEAARTEPLGKEQCCHDGARNQTGKK
jgi:hypothetical protein